MGKNPEEQKKAEGVENAERKEKAADQDLEGRPVTDEELEKVTGGALYLL